MFKAALQISLLAVFFASRAVAAGETSEANVIVEAGTSQSAVLRSPWDFRPSYSVSVLNLWESGQGFGARLNLLPSWNADKAWEFSADAVARLANDSPWYLKGVGGVAITPPIAVWPPRVRAGAEVGLTAIRGVIGLEAGIAAVVSFPPSRPAEGEVVVSLGMGILFGFGTPAPARAMVCRNDQPGGSTARGQQAPRPTPAESSVPQRAAPPPAGPVMGAVLAASPAGGGFNTCEGSRATPQCLQAMARSEGVANTSATPPPASGAASPTAAPSEGVTSSTARATSPSAPSTTLSGWKTAATAAASLGAALGLKSDEQRAQEAEHERLMRESAHTLEKLKRQQAQIELPAHRPSLPIKDPDGSATPRVDSQNQVPLSAPSTSRVGAIAEPDGESRAPFSLSNPYGQHGKPDHQAAVKRLVELAEREFPNAKIEAGTSIYKRTGVDRRPDVWARDTATNKVLKVYEAVRLNPDGSLPTREQQKKREYDQAGIPCHFEPVVP